jgi:hypothetical protein
VTAAAGLGRGERAPDMVLASRDGTPTRYYAHAGGRPALLVLADQTCAARLQALAEGLGGHCCIERSPFPAASTRPLNTADRGHDRVFQSFLAASP